MWIQGLYIKLAIGSSMSKDCKYPKSQFSKHKNSQISMREKFERQVERVNSRFRRETDE